MISEFLRRVISALEIIGVPYMLTGSLASSTYGVPRATNDIDIVVAPTRAQLLSLLQLFERVGLYATPREEAIAALARETQFNVIDFENGWKVDLSSAASGLSARPNSIDVRMSMWQGYN